MVQRLSRTASSARAALAAVAAGLALALTAVSAAAQADHMVAEINDSRSHGQIGDGFLSLNEFILLNKRALTVSALSPQEAGQILGFGTDVALGDVDYSTVSKITVERDLDSIEDTPHGFSLFGSYGAPTIDLNGSRGFVVNSNYADFRHLVLENAAVGISLTQGDAIFGTTIEDVTFRNLGTRGIGVTTAMANATTRLEIMGSTFDTVPTAIEMFDSGANRFGTLQLTDNEFRGGTNGLLVHLGPGGLLSVVLDRCRFAGTSDAIAFRRAGTGDTRNVVFSSLHLTVIGAVNGLSFQGSPSIADRLALRMADLGTQAQGSALRLWPLGTRLEATVEDSRISGDATLLTGTGAGILMANVRMRAGSLVLGSNGAPVRVADTILDSVSAQTQGTAPVAVEASRFVGGSVQGSASAPLQVAGCYVGNAAVGSHAQVSGSLPAPQLGSVDASPLEPRIGTTTTLQCDLPPNLVGAWFFGLAETIPYLGPRPLHIYFWLQFHVALPGLHTGQSQAVIPIPNDPSLVGFHSWVAQMAVVPLPGLVAPPLALPPGRRIVIR